MKRCIFLVPTFFYYFFFAEEVQKRAAGLKQIQPGDTVKVCQDLRATYPKEKVEAYFVMHIEGCMHAQNKMFFMYVYMQYIVTFLLFLLEMMDREPSTLSTLTSFVLSPL